MTSIDYPLGGGFTALIDAGSVDKLAGRTWRVVRCKGRLYAAASTTVHGKPKRIYMHRLLMGLEGCPSPFVDHYDGDGLNNTMGNLRTATVGQNAQNVRHHKYQYRGVTPSGKRFAARLGGVYLGTFPTAVEAAIHYDRIVVAKHGSMSRVNFPTTESSSVTT